MLNLIRILVSELLTERLCLYHHSGVAIFLLIFLVLPNQKPKNKLNFLCLFCDLVFSSCATMKRVMSNKSEASLTFLLL